MACFIVPAAEAVVVGIAAKVKSSSEKKQETSEEIHGWTWGQKLSLLVKLLAGGAVLLMFEHVWHGEVVPYFPFLSAMSSHKDTSEMLHEMSTVGVTMAAIVTSVWAGICVTADALVRRAKKAVENTSN